MTKRLIDTDDEVLEEAKSVIGAATYKEAVNAGLREILATQARRREIARFTSSEGRDIDEPATRTEAWR